MGGFLWADSPYGLFTFVLITLVLGGAGAWATGRAVAKTWRPLAMLAPYMLFLTAGVRFLHYALYGEPLLSPALFITAYIWTAAVAALGYRAMRARQMATQYSWAYERSGLSARPKGSS
ncbi:MAG TPA: hypothetical protein VN637_02590 [Roseiarcus sp.]|jgi:hypothetical protein|nr:hypothetical protein [Roseiarcus sp.]